MHISFTVPMWAMIGFGTIAYPSLGAIVASFLMRASNRRLPGIVVAASGVLWPVTLALGIVAFPLWLAGWLMVNYGDGIKRALQGRLFKDGAVSQEMPVATGSYTLHETVRMVRAFGSVLQKDCYGQVKDQKGTEVFVDFPSIGSFWVPMDCVRKN